MRLFAAIPLTVEVRTELAAVIAGLHQQVPGAKWVKTANLHLTLKFLGDVEPELVPEIVKALTLVAGQEQAFSCSLTHLGTFPTSGRPRVLYVATNQRQRLTSLFSRLEQRLSPLGFTPEGHFAPHITIARFHSSKFANASLIEKQNYSFKRRLQISGFSLIESRLTPKGAVYSTLNEMTFAS